MAEIKRKLQVFGFEVDVSEIPITEATEHFNQYTLEDGSIIKVKGTATKVLRVDNQFLPDGNPVYIVYMTAVTSVQSSPLAQKPKVTETAEEAAKKVN